LTEPSRTAEAAAALRSQQEALGAAKIHAVNVLELLFTSPDADPRVPDIIVQPNLGVIYTSSTKKIAEHGGFSDDDTNVALLVSGKGLRGQTLKTPVQTAQIAPTILWALGLEPDALQAVRREKTPVLPGVGGLGDE